MLSLIGGHGLVEFPPLDWRINYVSIIGLLVLTLLCYGSIALLRTVHDGIESLLRTFLSHRVWWQHALIASIGLSCVYLIGGPLIEFTGNDTIKPLITQASVLDCFALAGIVIAKIVAIAWSKSTGYRGGLVFPSFFILTGIILLVDQFVTFNFIYGIIFGLTGMFLANRRAKILF
jgi:H+/Cl- antiporter ClcA